MSADPTADPGSTSAAATIGPLENRFHVVSVACRRVMQIRGGARLHLDPKGHKECVVAVAEVMAGTVPYYVS